MGFSFLLILLLSSTTVTIYADNSIKSVHVLDQLIRDYTFNTIDKHFLKTGVVKNINFPANFSGIRVSTARFRCGSLLRYGAQINEFELGIGVIISPCLKRLYLVTQNLGKNWSFIFYNNYNLYGYELVSPVLGLLAYETGDLSELKIFAGKVPISINFSNFTKLIVRDLSGLIPLCASFENGGIVKLSKLISSNKCVVRRNGHYGLVIQSPLIPVTGKRVGKWKMTIGCLIGGGIGVFLLGLLLVAMFVKVKKRMKMEEIERRAYEEEALQVSMVDHVRAPVDHGSRVTPTIVYL